jgi:hypothetical protein
MSDSVKGMAGAACERGCTVSVSIRRCAVKRCISDG